MRRRRGKVGREKKCAEIAENINFLKKCHRKDILQKIIAMIPDSVVDKDGGSSIPFEHIDDELLDEIHRITMANLP